MNSGKDIVSLTFAVLHRTPSEKGTELSSQQARLLILVMRMTLLFVADRLTFDILCCTKCSVLSIDRKYFFFKSLPLELCTVFNVKQIWESGAIKIGIQNYSNIYYTFWIQEEFTNALFWHIIIHLPENQGVYAFTCIVFRKNSLFFYQHLYLYV